MHGHHAGSSGAALTRYIVHRYVTVVLRLCLARMCSCVSRAYPCRFPGRNVSSDVLEDMRINVSEEGSSKVVWYKASVTQDAVDVL